MKSLFLIRHGKAETPAGSQRDTDREIVERAFSDAQTMSERFFRTIEPPDQFLASNARRALQTAHLLADLCPGVPVPSERAELYLADPSVIWEVVREAFDGADSIWLVGHNPGLVEAAAYFTGEWCGSLPTFGTIHVQFPEDVILPGKGILNGVFRPKSFR